MIPETSFWLKPSDVINLVPGYHSSQHMSARTATCRPGDGPKRSAHGRKATAFVPKAKATAARAPGRTPFRNGSCFARTPEVSFAGEYEDEEQGGDEQALVPTNLQVSLLAPLPSSTALMPRL